VMLVGTVVAGVFTWLLPEPGETSAEPWRPQWPRVQEELRRPFVRVIDKPPHSKWATGSNLAYVSYAADPVRGIVIAIGAIDNLGKGAAGQAVQNANLITGQPETAGLDGTPLWP